MRTEVATTLFWLLHLSHEQQELVSPATKTISRQWDTQPIVMLPFPWNARSLVCGLIV